ncbi:glycosyltransferase family 9 protein [Pectinatus haikarae]|uniref:Lipopolysaccharide heptosyltransferase II n=1 Tax=Pectinatus haikarae TaxID=349096 RepID=A0ABT9YBU0_9FIRM|nr:glycosyltransferase family 9 protein [Pectinatus haikarae]MDQ0205179.1 lipopolysaccharide heptosyltransferase II [Pectinatus haikarae]
MDKVTKKPVYKNILVLNLRKIGDTIMATSAAYLLKKAYPEARLTMLVKPLTRSIAENNPVIDQVLFYDYSHKAKLRDIKKIMQKIKKEGFDLAVVIDNKPRSALLAWLSGVPHRLGFEKVTLRNIYLKLFYTKIYDIDYDFGNTQQVKNHEIFINRITGRNDKAKMILPDLPAGSREKIDKMLSALPAGKLKIALCMRSGTPFKDWPMADFAKVVHGLAEKYDAVFYVTGSSGDSSYAEKFIKNSKYSVWNFCGQTNLPELGCLLRQSDLLLSVDTGTAHLAAAAAIPEVVIFAGTSHRHWAPYGDKVSCLYPDIECYPCSDETRRQCTEYRCLTAVQPEQVLRACEMMLENNTDMEK